MSQNKQLLPLTYKFERLSHDDTKRVTCRWNQKDVTAPAQTTINLLVTINN